MYITVSSTAYLNCRATSADSRPWAKGTRVRKRLEHSVALCLSERATLRAVSLPPRFERNAQRPEHIKHKSRDENSISLMMTWQYVFGKIAAVCTRLQIAHTCTRLAKWLSMIMCSACVQRKRGTLMHNAMPEPEPALVHEGLAHDRLRHG